MQNPAEKTAHALESRREEEEKESHLFSLSYSKWIFVG